MGGTWPLFRRDGSPHVDKTSKKMAGKPLGFRGLLSEIRCDWAALKEVWDFPSWRSSHFCWQCKVTRENYKNTHLGANWRTELLDRWSFLSLLQRNGGVLNPLLGCPMVSAACFKLDWLHVCDQGITQRFVANIFSLWLEHQPGTSQEKLEALWEKLQVWYGRHAVEDRLQNLTSKMLKSSDNGFPKLRGSAAVVRKLVPFTVVLCGELDQASAEVRNSALACGLMVDCYEALPNFRGYFVFRFVGDGDQKKFTKNPRHFSIQNSQANTKKNLFTKFFWRAGKIEKIERREMNSKMVMVVQKWPRSLFLPVQPRSCKERPGAGWDQDGPEWPHLGTLPPSLFPPTPPGSFCNAPGGCGPGWCGGRVLQS